MKLQPVMDSLDDIPDEFRENYEPTDDGKFKLTIAGLVPEKDADQFEELKGALTKQRNDAATEKRKRQEVESALEALGGLEGIQELKAQQEEAERNRLEKKGEWDQLRQQMQEQHEAELEKERAKTRKLKGQLDREIRGRQVMEAIAKHDGNPTLLQPILMQATALAGDDDENLRVEVLKDGVKLVDGDGNDLSVEGYVERLREDEAFAGAFKGTGHSGGGGSGEQPPGPGGGAPNGGDGGGIPPELASLTRGQMTPRQKVDVQNALTEKHGGDRQKALEEFLQIPQ